MTKNKGKTGKAVKEDPRGLVPPPLFVVKGLTVIPGLGSTSYDFFCRRAGGLGVSLCLPHGEASIPGCHGRESGALFKPLV